MSHFIAGQLHDPEHFHDYNLTEEKEAKIISKEWGSEEIIHNTKHCVKIMRLKPGFQVSMHWHAIKSETFILISGQLWVEIINKKGKSAVTLLTDPLNSFTLYANTPHTFYCPDDQEEETVFIEASTTDFIDDSYRFYPSGPRKQDHGDRGPANR